MSASTSHGRHHVLDRLGDVHDTYPTERAMPTEMACQYYMRQLYNRVMHSRTANLLGALGIALADAQLKEVAASSGLQPTDAAALNAIGTVPGCSIATVRIALGVTHPGAVRAVDRLVDAGLVERHAGVDRRTVALHLSPHGEEVWRQQTDARLRWLDHTIAQLPRGERAEVERVASALLSVVTGDEESAERICRFCDEHRCPQRRCPVTLAAEADT
jgi:MarR family transcriptional regulator, negative regulator of the multidrug operon emrRAB